jgi:hypothetical protein
MHRVSSKKARCSYASGGRGGDAGGAPLSAPPSHFKSQDHRILKRGNLRFNSVRTIQPASRTYVSSRRWKSIDCSTLHRSVRNRVVGWPRHRLTFHWMDRCFVHITAIWITITVIWITIDRHIHSVLTFHYAYFVAFFLLFLRLHVRMTCASFFYPLPTLSPTCDSRFFRLIRSNNSSGSFRRSPLGHRRGLFTRLTFSIYLNLARAIARS